MYVTVVETSEEKLHLTRQPSNRSWSILIGLVSFGFGAAYYGADHLLWKLAYVCGSVFIGLTCLEEWEDCIFDKMAGQVEVMKKNIFQKYFASSSEPNKVVANLADISDVVVEEELSEKYAGKGYHVVLKFREGYSVGVTEISTIGDQNEHNEIVNIITKFLDLDRREGMPSSQESKVDDTSSSSDESFEKVDKAEIVTESQD
ncbi:cytochrome b-245 chaperone 1-like [Lineus longissimus]|uniref:cytochrome b-245 chaperone 1-like n=1 Tax=Lineus longissimus TaxID=88925 RepID=UPI002B4CB1E7